MKGVGIALEVSETSLAGLAKERRARLLGAIVVVVVVRLDGGGGGVREADVFCILFVGWREAE